MIGAQELRNALSIEAAIDALDAAFAGELPAAPQRQHLQMDGGDLLLMPAWGPQGVGVKLVTLNPANPDAGLPFVHAVYELFDAKTLAPVLSIDGAELTVIRTAAVSGVATRHLARGDSRTLMIFGAGAQAKGHLDAMLAVRDIERVLVASRTASSAEALAELARAKGVVAEAVSPRAVTEADIVCTCTTSSTPVFDGNDLKAGVHVNAVGAYRPDMRELDDATITRARIVVETRAAALAEAGDLLIPLGSGAIAPDAIVAELSDVARGAPVRTHPDDITVFKSVGVAFEDLVVAAAASEALKS